MKPAWVLPIVIVAVLAWGILHAYGAYTLNHNPWRAVVVIGCVLAFLVWWIALLAHFKRKQRNAADRGSDESLGTRP